MRRVRFIHLCRTLAQPALLRLYVLAGIVWVLVSSVSVHDVMTNVSQVGEMQGMYAFATYALMHTERLVQVGLLILIGLAILLVRDIARRSIRIPLRVF